MTAQQILITNLTTGNLSIDARSDKFSDKVIRATLGPAGQPAGVKPASSVDVAAAPFGWSLPELMQNAQIQALLNYVNPATGLVTPRISVTSVAATGPTIPGSPEQVANAAGLADVQRLTLPVPAGAGGAPDDVTVYLSVPFAARITDVQFSVSTAVAASNVQLRTATGGLGTALSDLFGTATTGRKRDAGGALLGVIPSVAAGSAIYLRRSDSGVAGTLEVDFERLS